MKYKKPNFAHKVRKTRIANILKLPRKPQWGQESSTSSPNLDFLHTFYFINDLDFTSRATKFTDFIKFFFYHYDLKKRSRSK